MVIPGFRKSRRAYLGALCLRKTPTRSSKKLDWRGLGVALLRRLPEHCGLSRVNEAGYLADPPELIVEVAASFASIDLRDKRRAYLIFNNYVSRRSPFPGGNSSSPRTTARR